MKKWIEKQNSKANKRLVHEQRMNAIVENKASSLNFTQRKLQKVFSNQSEIFQSKISEVLD